MKHRWSVFPFGGPSMPINLRPEILALIVCATPRTIASRSILLSHAELVFSTDTKCLSSSGLLEDKCLA
jgi:hypothetical protein